MTDNIRYMTNRVCGFTLVELMISMVLGLTLMSGVISIFLAVKQSYVQQNALSQIQENARFAMEMLARDTRMAGFTGCGSSAKFANTLSDNAGLISQFKQGIQGFDDSDTFGFPVKLAKAESGTDAIVIHSLSQATPHIVQEHLVGSSTLKFIPPMKVKKNILYLLLIEPDCSNLGMFSYVFPSGMTGKKSKLELSLNGGANCTKSLKGNFDCTDSSASQHFAYSYGSSLFVVDSFAFFVAKSVNDKTALSLYKKSMKTGSIAEELVEGVSNLQIMYALKDASHQVQYKPASAITDEQWKRVLAVRYQLTMASGSVGHDSTLSKSFTKTIQLRNGA